MFYKEYPGRTIQAVYGYFTDRITAVLSGTEIRPYHNEITARIRLYTVKMRPRIRGAVLLCPRLRENTVRLRRRMKQIYGENMGSRID
jgi:hypothetical protein